MAIYGDGKHNENMEYKAQTNDKRPILDKINVQDLINFLEYEEALTTDKQTAARIKNYLMKIGIWS